MISRNIGLILVVLLAGWLEPALAATLVVDEKGRPARNVIVIDGSHGPVRPLYSDQCIYKTAMNDLDMRRCGVFLYGDPLSTALMSRSDLRSGGMDRGNFYGPTGARAEASSGRLAARRDRN